MIVLLNTQVKVKNSSEAFKRHFLTQTEYTYRIGNPYHRYGWYQNLRTVD